MGDGAEVTRAAAAEDATSMRQFLEMTIDLITVLDLQTTILAASRSYERTLGWTPEELIGTSMLDLFHPDDMPRILDELATLLDGGDAIAVAVRVRTKDGAYRWVQGNARSDVPGNRIYVTGTDIAERVSLEDALRRQVDLEELVAAIAARLIGAEWGHVTNVIEGSMADLARALGADRGHFLRGPIGGEHTTYVEWRDPATPQRDLSPVPDDDVRLWWRRALEQQRLLRLDDVEELRDEAPNVVDALHADGVRSLLHVPLPFHSRHWGFITMVAVREQMSFSDDVTGLLRLAGECFMTALAERDHIVALDHARHELELRNEELERANEELERFAHAAAHDLKAPLSRVEMALAATPAFEGPADQLLDVARRAASRMRQLIEDLLTFAAAGSTVGPKQPVDLNEVLSQVLIDLEPITSARGITVERFTLPTIPGHRALLGQLLQNLIGNAVKFTREDATPRVQVEALEAADGVTIVVRDNGIGIAPEHREEVFGMFSRMNGPDAYPGSGIGLATCAKVVAHHQGRIWIEDGLDGGTAVHVWLPRGHARSSPAAR